MPRFIIPFLLLTVIQIPYSQNKLSLEDAVSKAIANNKALKIELMNVDLANADLAKLNSANLPHVQFNHQYLISDDPLNAFGFKLRQSQIQNSDFQADLLNNPEVAYLGNTQLSLKQAIFHYDLLNLKKALKARVNSNKENGYRIEEKIILEVRNAFSDLQFLYAALETSKSALNSISENEMVINNLLSQGLAKKSDVLHIQSELSEIEFNISKLNFAIKNLSAYLAYLMGDAEQAIYSPAQDLNRVSIVPVQVNLTERADFKSMQAGIDSRTYSRKSVANGFIPKINAFGELNFYDKQIIGFDQKAFLAGFQLQWDLFNGNSRSFETRKLKLEIEKSKMEMKHFISLAHLEINQKMNDWNLTDQEITAAQKSILLAEEIRKISKDRYNQGLEKTVDVLNADVALLQKKLKSLEIITRQNKITNELEYLHAIQKN